MVDPVVWPSVVTPMLSQCCKVVCDTYDTIKRALTIKGALTPMTPAATQLPPSYGVITPRQRRPPGERRWRRRRRRRAGGGGTDGGGHPHPDAVGIWL